MVKQTYLVVSVGVRGKNVSKAAVWIWFGGKMFNNKTNA